MSPEALQAEVERLRLALARAEARAEAMAEALALVSSGRHADTGGRMERIREQERERKRAQRERQQAARHADSSGSHAEVTRTEGEERKGGFPEVLPPRTPLSPTSSLERENTPPPPSQGELLAVQAPRKSREKRQPSGSHQELWAALEAEYQQHMGHAYISTNGDRDGKAVKWLVEHSTLDETVERWGRLLEWAKGGFPAVTGFQALQQHWNTAQVAGAGPPRQQRGSVSAPTAEDFERAYQERRAGGGT